MSEKDQLVSIDPKELLGEEWISSGPIVDKRYFRVADGIDYISHLALKNGLKMLEVSNKYKGTLYALYREDRNLGELVPMWSMNGENQGVWVQEPELRNFRKLFSVDEGAVG